MQATSADRMKAYSEKGATRVDQRLMSTNRPQDGIASRNRGPGPLRRRGQTGLDELLRRQRRRRLAPGDRLARKQEGLRKDREDLLEVVQGDHHRAALAMPALHEPQQVVARGRVDAGERLVEKDDRAHPAR